MTTLYDVPEAASSGMVTMTMLPSTYPTLPSLTSRDTVTNSVRSSGNSGVYLHSNPGAISITVASP